MNTTKINECLAEVLNKSLDEMNNIAVSDDLIPKGLSSIAFVQLIVLLESSFCIEIKDEHMQIDKMNTIEKIVHVLTEYII